MPREVAKPHNIGGKSHPLAPADADIAALADRQHGVVANRQLLALGLGPRAIEHRIAVGRLHRVHKGIYVVGRRTLTPRGHWMAAALAYGPDAVISHRTAAALLGLRPTNQRKIDITVPSSRRSRPTITAHRGQLHAEDRIVLNGIPTTSVPRTLLDLAPLLYPDQLMRAIEQAVRLGRFDLTALERTIARGQRRPGVKCLQSALADYRDPPPTRSELERQFHELISNSDLPSPLVNVLVAGLEVDFFWPQSRLVVELDGRGYHTSPRAFETDRIRDAKLQRARCHVLRITHRRLQDHPTEVLQDIEALL